MRILKPHFVGLDLSVLIMLDKLIWHHQAIGFVSQPPALPRGGFYETESIGRFEEILFGSLLDLIAILSRGLVHQGFECLIKSRSRTESDFLPDPFDGQMIRLL